ncbi:hypothetical protein HJD18_11620 [Thermoleophilia bacterium SCSIO 60948]|nr:hypothetical protein HJD18_11620 [Thermoleophilia bacterium SCSIO 60948]
MTPSPRRRALARATSAALLSIAGAFALCAPASAADPDPKPGKVVADSGFRPATNGYGFANYGSEPGVVDLGPGQMRRLFGDRVCSSTSGGCTLTPAAQEWMDDQNEGMAGGHCFGMATTAQFFFQGFGTPEQPDAFGSPFITRLGFDGNEKLQRHIARAWATQSLPNVRKTFAGGVPSKVVKLLRLTLAEGRMPYELLMFDDGDGHAISPYAVNRLKKNRYQLLVYDNNYPGEKRALNLNTEKETWRYQIQPGTVWSGNAKTKTLAVGNPRPGIGKNPCPFCKNDPQADSDPANDETPGRVELRLQGSGPTEELADMRVTDGDGAAGVGPNGVFDDLSGADVYTPVTGVLFSDPFFGAEESASPQLTLDPSREYEVRLTQPQALGATQSETVTMTGPGYSLGAVTETSVGERDRLVFDAEERRVGVIGHPIGGGPIDLTATVNEADADYDIDLKANLPSGAQLFMVPVPGEQQLKVLLIGADSLEAELTVTTQTSGGSTTDTRTVELSGAEENIIDF